MTAFKHIKHFFTEVTAVLLLFAALLNVGGAALSNADAAAADNTYLWARVVDDDIFLYATDRSSKVICALEKSYYLKILDTNDSMLFVSVMQNEVGFPEICGYVYASEVELSAAEPLAPYYPTVKTTVSADSAGLKLTPTPSSETVLTATNTQQLSYYGSVSSYGKEWYYVYYGGKFGYVEADCVTKPKIALHPTPLVKDAPVTTTPSEEPITENPPEQNVSPAAEILLIVFVALLAVGLILALFLPGNLKKRGNVFDQDI